MLEFIFDYTWVAMLVIVYVIWSIESIRDIINTTRMYDDDFDICFLDDGTLAWVAITVFCIFAASFIHYLLGGPLG